MTRRRSALAACLLALLVATPVLASHVTPEVVDGSQSCGPLSPGTVELVVEVPQGVGAIEDGDFTVDVALDGNVGNGALTFSNASLPVAAALVAGAQSGNLYRYEEPVTEDDGLVAPDGQPILDVSFCYVAAGDGSGEGDSGEGDSSGTPTGDAAGDAASDTPPQTDTAPPGDRTGASKLLLLLGAALLTGVIGLELAARQRRLGR